MGLLDKFNRGMGAIETGLLGNATAYNPAIAQYLSPGTLDKANKDARMQLGLAMLAASESGMGMGQGLMMAQQMAGQAFQQPIQNDIQQFSTADALRRIQEQRAAKEKLDQQIALYRQAHPESANEPDEVILKRMDPSFGIQTAQLGLEQQRTAQDTINSDRNYELQRQQLAQQQAQAAQSRANSDRQYELERLKMQQDEARFRAQLEAQGGKVDEVEVRQRRAKADGSRQMLGTLGQLREQVSLHGTEAFGQKSGVQGNLYGQALAQYKQAEQLGTLDKGLLDLFDKMLTDPTSWGAAANPFAKQKILSQLDTLIASTEEQYNNTYDYLKSNEVDAGFQPIRSLAVGSEAFMNQLESEGKKRKLW